MRIHWIAGQQYYFFRLVAEYALPEINIIKCLSVLIYDVFNYYKNNERLKENLINTESEVTLES